MKQILIASAIVLFLILSCGCTGAPPAQPPPATSTTMAPPPQVVHTSLPAPVSTPERTASVSDNTITIIRNTFSPANMTVKIGSTVRWVNADDHPHRIAFTKEGFLDTPYLLGSSQSASQRFDSAGTYDYYCTIHPQMQGTITAEA